jgi:thymidylate synthase (FAD)
MARHIVPEAEALIDISHPVLDHGFVRLVDYMGSDAAVAEAARVSMAGKGVKTTSDDRSLIRRLVSDLHTSPLEMVEMKFHCCMPIFVARQWIRHRTANVNEMSARYSELPELTYVPEVNQIAYQNPVNKQGRGGLVPESVATKIQEIFRGDADGAFSTYHELLGKASKEECCLDLVSQKELEENGGISRELARINLPLSAYTQWYWKIDLHNLLHFLFLRLDKHAQWEIRQYAEVIARLVKALCPIVWEAFVDYRLESVRFSGPEAEIIAMVMHSQVDSALMQSHLGKLSKRELGLLRDKGKRLGIQWGGVSWPDQEKA